MSTLAAAVALASLPALPAWGQTAIERVSVRLSGPAPGIAHFESCKAAEAILAERGAKPLRTVRVPAAAGGGCLVSFEPRQGGGSAAERTVAVQGIIAALTETAEVIFAWEIDCRRVLDGGKGGEEGGPFGRKKGGAATATSSNELSGQVVNSVGQGLEGVPVLLRGPHPATPEDLVLGRERPWVPGTDDRGPEVSVTGEDGVIAIPLDGSIAVTFDTAYVEVANECDGFTTRVRKPKVVGGTKERPPRIREDDEEIVLAPPDDPPVGIPEEKLDPTIPCCGMKDGVIYYPITKDYLEQEDEKVPQPNRQDVAYGGYKVLLHSGAMLNEVPDMRLASVGMDFVFTRTYRGDMKTLEGGMIGHRWDFSYNKRIVPEETGGVVNALQTEKVRGGVAIFYYNGHGRRDRYAPLSAGWRRVKNFGQDFKAYVTTYKSPPGAFHEIQRYILENPKKHPWRKHPAVDAKNDESIFYVLRTKEHILYIFNCRGQLIHIYDRHENRYTFEYGGHINPLTHNKMLSKITDSGGRDYRVQTVFIGTGDFLTNYDCRVVSNAGAPIPRVESITDSFGRRLVFEYDRKSMELVRVRLEFGAEHLTRKYGYAADHRLAAVTAPAQFKSGGPYLTNEYDDKGRIKAQSLGGGSYRLKYHSREKVEVTDPNNNRRVYTLDQNLITQIAHHGAAGPDRGPWTTKLEHNDDGQVIQVTLPRGNRLKYTYAKNNGTVSIQESPIVNWVDRQLTYANNLAKGNLLKVERISHLGSDKTKSIHASFAYEPLYNQISKQTNYRGAVTAFAYKYDKLGSNGNAVEIKLPAFKTADGKTVDKVTLKHGFHVYGEKASTTDAAGNRTTFAYDRKTGRLTGTTYPVGEAHALKRDERGNVIEETPPGGPTVKYRVNLRDQVTEAVVDPDGAAARTRFRYDLNGNKVWMERERKDVFKPARGAPKPGSWGKITLTQSYDIRNRVVSQTEKAGSDTRSQTMSYDGNGNLVSATGPAATGGSITTGMSYDGADRLIRVSMGKMSSSMAYDANGNNVKTVDPKGNVLTQKFDGLDRLIETTDAYGSVTRLKLDENGNVLSREVEGPTGASGGGKATLARVDTVYDEHNRPIVQRDALLAGGKGTAETKWIFDRLGHLVGEIDPEGGLRKIERDALGRSTRITDAAGNITELAYGGGQLASLTEYEVEPDYDPATGKLTKRTAAYSTSFAYDSLGHMSKRAQGSATTRMFYDSDGNMRGTIDAAGRASKMSYDGFGRLVSVERGKRTTTMTYGGTDKPLTITTPLDVETRKYDAFGRLTEVSTRGAGQKAAFSYDAAGNLLTSKDANGNTLTMTYNALNRPTKVSSGGAVETYRYDGLGRVVFASTGTTSVTRTYDGLGNIVREDQTLFGDTQTVKTTFGAKLRSRTVTYPKAAGAVKAVYKLDALGRVQSVDAAGEATRYDYAGIDRVALRTTGDLRFATHHKYDGERRLSELAVYDAILKDKFFWKGYARHGTHGQSEVAERFYPTGNDFGAVSIQTVKHVYDDRGRLTSSLTSVSSRKDSRKPWLHSFTQKHNAYSRSGRLIQVATSQAAVEKDGFFIPGQQVFINEVRLDTFDLDRAARIKKVRTVVDTTKIKAAQNETGLSLSDIRDITTAGKNKKKIFRDKQDILRDGNGNIVRDSQFTYGYDHRNRLVKAEDLLSIEWNQRYPGFKQAVEYIYDAFGRPVLRRYVSSTEQAKAFDRKDVRFLYLDSQVIAEIGTDWRNKTALLARYFPGAKGGEVLRMDRRKDDKLDGKLESFYLHEGMTGDIAFVSRSESALLKHSLKPHFTGQLARPQMVRSERFIQDSTTRNPYLSRGLRYDAFTRMHQQEGTSHFVYDYRAAPMMEIRRYTRDNWAKILAKIDKHHPQPAALRNMEYAMTGVMLLGLAPMVPAAAPGLAAMGGSGVVGVGVEYGASKLFGHDYKLQQAVQGFAINAITGGFGKMAGGWAAMAGLSRGRATLTAITVDTVSSTALEVGLTGGEFGKSFTLNALSSVIGGAVSHRLSRARPSAPSRPARAVRSAGRAASNVTEVRARIPVGPPTTGLYPRDLFDDWHRTTRGGLDDFVDTLNEIAKLARVMPEAREFLHDFNAGNLQFVQASRKIGPDLSKASYGAKSLRRQAVVIAFDPRAEINGFRVEGGHYRRGGGAEFILVNPRLDRYRFSPKYMAATLLHEFVHYRLGNELHAFHVTYMAMVHSGLHLDSLYKNTREVRRAANYVKAIQQARQRGNPQRILGALGAVIHDDYFVDMWQRCESRARFETSVAGWGLGLPPPPH